jgi:DNA-binding transcriptional regulator YhcF (GntR family)
MSQGESRVWTGFSRFQVPTAIAQQGSVLLGGIEATVLLVLFKLANTAEPREPLVTVRASIKTLTVQTGLAEKSVRRALESLRTKFIKVHRGRKANGRQFGANTYLLLNPETQKPLKTQRAYGVCFLNSVPYFPVPTDIVKRRILARLSVSEKSLYIALLIVAGRNQRLTFTATPTMLAKLSGLSPKTYRKAVEKLELAGLILRDGQAYTMCDPVTREQTRRYARAEDDPKKWTIEGKKALDYDTLSPQQWKQVIDACFKQSYVYAEEGWTAATKCPFHSGETKPTLSFNFEMGCYKCHSTKCTAKGKLSRFVKTLRKISEQETQEFIARSVGIELKFNRTTKDAAKTWRYFNENYTLVKEVFFFADGEIVEKANGQGKLLYHLPEVRASRTVLVLRNESDCDQMDQLKLRDSDGRPVATTTGGYLTGWLPKFAAELDGKNVVVMHVSDRGGIRFYKTVADSLDEFGIQHRHISVKEGASASVEEIIEQIGADWLYRESQTTDAAYGLIEL